MSRHHVQKKWANKSAKARARILPLLPQPCVECHRPVYPSQAWDVAHIVSLSLGGDPTQYGPAHRTCNRSAGGRLGAAARSKIDPRTLPTDRDRSPSW